MYKSIKEACDDNNCDNKIIIRSCKTKKCTCSGYRFLYEGCDLPDLYFLDWKPMYGFSKYLISDKGEIYSKPMDRLMKLTISCGKYNVGLPEGSKGVHLLVAKTYIPKFFKSVFYRSQFYLISIFLGHID